MTVGNSRLRMSKTSRRGFRIYPHLIADIIPRANGKPHAGSLLKRGGLSFCFRGAGPLWTAAACSHLIPTSMHRAQSTSQLAHSKALRAGGLPAARPLNYGVAKRERDNMLGTFLNNLPVD